ncbi:MAG: hypothetical protein II802_01545, partial [Clostridia bacterium]|nr:hypothetical protein [Clostridia bacterium]
KTNGEKGILYNIKFRFMNFDMLTVVFPKALLSLFKKISVFLLRVALIFSAGSVFGTNLCPDLFRYIFNFFGLTKEKAVNSFSAVVLLLLFTFSWTVYNYLNGILMAVYVYIIERRRIPYIKWYKKVWFCITFPIFDLIGKLALVIAIFKRVEWKPIPHCSDVKINEISGI